MLSLSHSYFALAPPPSPRSLYDLSTLCCLGVCLSQIPQITTSYRHFPHDVFSAPFLARAAQAPPVPVDDVRVPEVPSEEIQSAPDRGVLWEMKEREREKG